MYYSVMVTQKLTTTHDLVTTDEIIKWTGISSCRIEQHRNFVEEGRPGWTTGWPEQWDPKNYEVN